MNSLPESLFSEYVSVIPRAVAGSAIDREHFRKVTDSQWEVGMAYLVITTIFEIFSILVVGARVYTRTVPRWRLEISDCLVTLAFVFTTVMWALHVDGLAWAFHPRPEYRNLASVTRATRNGMIALPFWACGTGLAKISIAFTLLKFQQSRGWRYFVYAIVFLNIVFIAFVGIALTTRCIPYAATWDMVGKYKGKKVCWSRSAIRGTVYVTLICNVTSDIALSLVPLTFLSKVRRPLREKTVIAVLMALGIFASAFSIARVIGTWEPHLTAYLAKDPSAFAIFAGLMTCLEAQCSLIAACIPMLRRPTARLLERLGLIKSSDPFAGPGDLERNTEVTEGKQSRGVLELNQVAGRGREGESSDRSTCTQNTNDSSLDSGQFVMDPETGRIIRVTPGMKDWNSSSNLNEEWAHSAA